MLFGGGGGALLLGGSNDFGNRPVDSKICPSREIMTSNSEYEAIPPFFIFIFFVGFPFSSAGRYVCTLDANPNEWWNAGSSIVSWRWTNRRDSRLRNCPTDCRLSLACHVIVEKIIHILLQCACMTLFVGYHGSTKHGLASTPHGSNAPMIMSFCSHQSTYDT